MKNLSTLSSKIKSQLKRHQELVKLVSRGIPFIIGFIVITCVLQELNNRVDPSQEYLRFKNLIQRRNSITALAAGHSHNMALNFRTLGYKGYHVWNPDEDIFETEFVLKTLIPRLPKLKVVFIPVAYRQFCFENTAKDARTLIVRNRQFYYLLKSLPEIEGRSLYSYISGFILNISRNLGNTDHGYSFFGSLFKFDNNKILFPYDKRTGRTVMTTHMDYEKLKTRTITIAVPEQLSQQSEMLKQRPDLPLATYHAMQNIIQYLQTRKIRVVFYTPPYFEWYTKIYDKGTINLMRTNMKHIVEEFGIEYYDHSTDKDFISNNHFFVNGSHLNEDGARIFSEKFKREISI